MERVKRGCEREGARKEHRKGRGKGNEDVGGTGGEGGTRKRRGRERGRDEEGKRGCERDGRRGRDEEETRKKGNKEGKRWCEQEEKHERSGLCTSPLTQTRDQT